MNSNLENYYNYIIELDMTNYKLYSILLRKYLKNAEGIENISDDDLYKYARKENFKKYSISDKEKEELNEKFNKEMHNFSDREHSVIPGLLGRIYVLTDFTISSDKLDLDSMLKIDSYFNDYFKCLEKVCIGYELNHTKTFNIENDGDKLTLKFTDNNK